MLEQPGCQPLPRGRGLWVWVVAVARTQTELPASRSSACGTRRCHHLLPCGRHFSHHLGQHLPWLARYRVCRAPIPGFSTTVKCPRFHAFQHLFSAEAFPSHTLTTTDRQDPVQTLSRRGLIAQVCPTPSLPHCRPPQPDFGKRCFALEKAPETRILICSASGFVMLIAVSVAVVAKLSLLTSTSSSGLVSFLSIGSSPTNPI